MVATIIVANALLVAVTRSFLAANFNDCKVLSVATSANAFTSYNNLPLIVYAFANLA